MKVDPTVKKETLFVLGFVGVLSALMQAVFLVIGKWDLTVLWGNLLGGGAAVLNFFLMGLAIQKAVGREEQEIKNQIRLSQTARMLMLFAVALVGYLVPVFHVVAVVLPFLFPRISVMVRSFVIRNQK